MCVNVCCVNLCHNHDGDEGREILGPNSGALAGGETKYSYMQNLIPASLAKDSLWSFFFEYEFCFLCPNLQLQTCPIRFVPN